jgi:predicted nuclease with TOPRIM domain
MTIENLYHDLVNTNSNLWEIEDRLRVLELESKFEGEFIDLARKVYITNDRRFELKNEINSITSSEIREVKEYVNYKR